MAEEAPKIEQPTGEHAEAATTTAAATDMVAKAKLLAESAQTAVIEQGDKVKAKVVESTADSHSHDTETDTTQQGSEHAEAATPEVVAKAKVLAEAAQTAVIENGNKVKDKVVGATEDSHDTETETDTTQQGGNVKGKVVGMVEATKTGVAQSVDKAQGYLNQAGSTDPASPNPSPTEEKE